MKRTEWDGHPAWRVGIEASLRSLNYCRTTLRDQKHPAYIAALDELEIYLKAMLGRGEERATSELMSPERAGMLRWGRMLESEFIDCSCMCHDWMNVEQKTGPRNFKCCVRCDEDAEQTPVKIAEEEERGNDGKDEG